MAKKRRRYYPPPVLRALDGPIRTLTTSQLRDFQLWMADLIVDLPAVYLGAFMGSGKTASVLRAVKDLIVSGEVSRVLVVAPFYVATDTWPDEIVKCAFARSLKFSVLVGTPEERETARQVDVPIHIVNRENLVWLRRQWKGKWPYDMLVYDEATRLQDGSVKTAETTRKDGSVSKGRLSAFGALAQVRFQFKRVVLLSGSPSPQGLLSLWGPLYIIDFGRRLGRNKTAFLRRWFISHKYSYGYEPRAFAEVQIMKRVRDVFFCLNEADYDELPEVVVNDRWVTLPETLMKKYRRFARTLVYEDLGVEAASQGVLCNKLLQLANGSLYIDDDGNAERIHEEKIGMLASVFEEAQGTPVMIGYSFKFDVQAILKKFPFVKVFGEDPDDVRNWNEGRYKGMLLHPASAGHGLNFQDGGNIAAWYGLNWSLELYQQFNRRLARPGQKASRVFLHRLLARGTMDEAVSAALEDKDATQQSIMEAVAVRLVRDPLEGLSRAA